MPTLAEHYQLACREKKMSTVRRSGKEPNHIPHMLRRLSTRFRYTKSEKNDRQRGPGPCFPGLLPRPLVVTTEPKKHAHTSFSPCP